MPFPPNPLIFSLQNFVMPTQTIEQTPVLTHYRFSVEDYHRMADLGFFPQGARIELLDGEIVEMSPAKSKHAGMIIRLTRLLGKSLGAKAAISIQNPISLNPYSEPEPDVAVLKPRPDDYSESHPVPEDILFLIEVSDTTLAKDRKVKLPLYAKAGIPEVWIVDLEGEQVEVYTEPGPEGYSQMKVFAKGKEVEGVLNGKFLIFS